MTVTKLGYFYLTHGLFELQVKQPKVLGHLYPFGFAVHANLNGYHYSITKHNSITVYVTHTEMESTTTALACNYINNGNQL